MNISPKLAARLVALCCLVLITAARGEFLFDEDASEASYQDENCGSAPLNTIQPRDAPTHRIINGKRPTYGEWPSFVRIDEDCSGVLISDRQVLTAAGCITPIMRDNLPSIKITLGDHQIWSVDEGEQVQQGVESICVSPKWLAGPLENLERPYDFAVIRLREPVRLSEYVQPACLPPADRNARVHLKSCHLIGVGLTQLRPAALKPSFVQKLAVKLANRTSWAISPGDPSRTCWVSRDMDTALVMTTRAGPFCARRRWTVVALTSFGEDDCEYRRYKAIVVFSSVPRLLEQIKSDCNI